MVLWCPPTVAAEAGPQLVLVDRVAKVRPKVHYHRVVQELVAHFGVNRVPPAARSPPVDRNPAPTAPRVAYIGVGVSPRVFAPQRLYYPANVRAPAVAGRSQPADTVSNAHRSAFQVIRRARASTRASVTTWSTYWIAGPMTPQLNRAPLIPKLVMFNEGMAFPGRASSWPTS